MRISDWSSDVCSSDLWERDCRAEAANAMSAAARNHRRPQHRIQVEPLVPRRMQAVEEVQPRARACRELRVVAQLLLEPHLQCRVLRQHLRSDEHTSELQSLMRISYAVFCLTKKQIHPCLR